MRHLFLAAAAAAAVPLVAHAESHDMGPAGDLPAAVGVIMNRDGEEVGTVRLVQTQSGFVWGVIQAEGFDQGVNGVHLHETGACDAPDFTSAGGHIAGDNDHGIMSENGPHPGDLPNVHIQDDGIIAAQFFNDRVTIDGLLEGDGSAFMIHNLADDYEEDPGGAAGDRIACAVLTRALDE